MYSKCGCYSRSQRDGLIGVVPSGALLGTYHRAQGLLGRGLLPVLPARELSVSLQMKKSSQAFPPCQLPGASPTRYSRYGGPPSLTFSSILCCVFLSPSLLHRSAWPSQGKKILTLSPPQWSLEIVQVSAAFRTNTTINKESFFEACHGA